MNERQLAEVYEMVDNIPFSRQKKNISRDFSDALMMAQLIHHYYPKKVQIHNYPSTNAVNKKIINWNLLNTKVLKKMGLALGKKQIENIANAKPFAIQNFLYRFLVKFEKPQQQMKLSNQFQYPRFQQQGKTQYSNGKQMKYQNPTIFSNKKGQMIKVQRQSEDTEQILTLIDQIDYAYSQMTKLQEMCRLKQDVIRNLEKKVQKVIFN